MWPTVAIGLMNALVQECLGILINVSISSASKSFSSLETSTDQTAEDSKMGISDVKDLKQADECHQLSIINVHGVAHIF